MRLVIRNIGFKMFYYYNSFFNTFPLYIIHTDFLQPTNLPKQKLKKVVKRKYGVFPRANQFTSNAIIVIILRTDIYTKKGNL